MNANMMTILDSCEYVATMSNSQVPTPTSLNEDGSSHDCGFRGQGGGYHIHLSKPFPGWPTPPLDRCASSRPSSCAPPIHHGVPSHAHHVVPRPCTFFAGSCAIVSLPVSTAPKEGTWEQVGPGNIAQVAWGGAVHRVGPFIN